MAEVDEALQQAADLEQLSFHGLAHWLDEVGKLLERAAFAEAAKNPRKEEAALAERKDELLEVQAQFRQAMGTSLQKLSLSKRERPLAEEFLKSQLVKLEVHAKTDARAAKPMDKLRKLLEDVRASPPAVESREVRNLEAEQKQLDAEWKEVSPIFDRWEAGRQTFKSNDELQKFKRRYEACKKTRDAGPERLQKALWAKRTGKEREEEPSGPPPGWAAVAKRQPAAAPARPKVASGRFQGTDKPVRAATQNRWGSGFVSFAQRLRSDMVSSVRTEVENEASGQAEQDDDWGDEDSVDTSAQRRPPPPAVPVMPKKPPPLPASVPAAPADTPFWDEDEAEAPDVAQNAGNRNKASAKKKGKAKKKKGGNVGADEDDDDVPPEQEPVPTAKISRAPPAWFAGVQEMVTGSLLQDLLRQGLGCWQTPEDPNTRLEELAERLPWSSPLGLQLPLEWTEFVGLPIDGGPRRTSKRGTAPWVVRLQKNIPWLLANYVTVFFVVGVMDALSTFGLLLWGTAAQFTLILAPPEVPYLRAPARCFLLQAVHLVVWALFVRAMWQTHLLVKLLLALAVVGHSYVVAEEALE